MVESSSPRGIVKSMGLVFGDIGTSPIYTLTAIFLLIPPTPDNMMGILSLIIWTLTILVTLEYTYLAMHLGDKGEGGTIVLKEILLPLVKTGNQAAFVSLLAVIGISLFIGDGVITPAISILSAVEGVVLIPGFESVSQSSLILIAGFIAIGLFVFQARGSERVALAFGPIMVVWFACLAITGCLAIMAFPKVLLALNPLIGYNYLMKHGIEGFFILSSVILCATGGEALYADMGHLGREPIVHAWYFVFIALALTYLGQGAFLLTHPDAKNILFEMVFFEFPAFYIAFLLLSIAATVIASQAMISGIFSVIYQGMTTRLFPLLKIEFTSIKLRSQIYIDIINWLLMVSVLLVILIFRSSANLTHAYGFAVSGTMAITGVFLVWIYYKRDNFRRLVLSLFVMGANCVFFLATLHKIPDGGYWSILFAMVPFAIILIFTGGQDLVLKTLRPTNFSDFIQKFKDIYPSAPKIPGTALFFARNFHKIPQYITRTMFADKILYEENVIISIIRTDKPFGVNWSLTRMLSKGFSILVINIGYMEVAEIEPIIKEAGIEENTIFYGLEEIVTEKPVWRIFAAIKRLSPSVVQFYRLPPDKIHGVVTRVEI